MIAFTVGNTYYGLFMIAVEAYMMSTCHYELYGLSPIDSLALQRAVRGYDWFSAVTIPL